MKLFGRRKVQPDIQVKAAEFHPTVVETIRVLGAGWFTGTYGAMYRKQPAVRTVVDLLARNIAQLNIKVYERVGDTDRLEVNMHPLAQLLRRPNPSVTRYRHMYDTVADLAIYDRAYWIKMRRGRELAVMRWSPAKMTVETDARTMVRTYRRADGVEIPRSQLVIFAGYSPDTDDEGVSPLETLRRVLLEEQTVSQARENIWRNAQMASGWILRPGDAPEWSDTARQRFRADVEGTLAGAGNAGRIGVLEEGMTPVTGQTMPRSTEYVESRRLTYEEVAVCYGIDPSNFGMGNETKANAEQYHKQLYTDVLPPWLRRIQDEIELQLLPDVDPLTTSTYVEFNIADKLKGSFEEEARTLVTSTGVPVAAVNEARARLNLPRIDDPAFDVPVKPLNVLYGGQPAVTVPTADRSTPALPPAGTAALPAGRPQFKTASASAIARRDRAAKDHEDLFRKFFARQEQAVVSAKAVKVDRERWDRELTADLYLLATQVTRQTGKLAARQLRGVYDEQRTFPWLAENARITAEAINAHTFDQVTAAVDGDEVRHVFEIAKGSRSEQLGLGRATLLVNFARTEAGRHSQDADGRQRTKTWTVTSARSRHPELDGETRPIDDVFSNGLRWPGDGANGDADDVANCRCLMNLT